jgi:UDP:flavonoid glycosyltransferase YjiC (YdhE family)
MCQDQKWCYLHAQAGHFIMGCLKETVQRMVECWAQLALDDVLWWQVTVLARARLHGCPLIR